MNGTGRSPRTPRPGRALGLVFSVALTILLLVPLPVAAQTGLSQGSVSKSSFEVGSGGAAPGLTLVFHGLGRVPFAGVPLTAGTQSSGAPGESGVVRVLPRCAPGPCFQSFRGASTDPMHPGDAAEVVTFHLLQPTVSTGASGFLVEVSVHTLRGWWTASGYFATGTTTSVNPQSITITLYVDLGTRLVPTVLAFEFAADRCLSATECP